MAPARASPGEDEWTLTHVVRCHARGVSSSDARVKVWGAAFLPEDTDWPAPDGVDPPARPVLVATAGENSLAIQDARTGEVVLKYRHPEREDFYCVVATVAEQPRRDGSGAAPWRLPIVAAAGGAGTVKLVSPAHRVVYAELRGHKKNINGLAVHPHRPRELFSASSDCTILAWDIGALDQAADPARCVRWCLEARIEMKNRQALTSVPSRGPWTRRGGLARMVAEYTAASAPVVSVAVHADRGWLLGGNEDGTVNVYAIVEKGTVRPLVRLKHDTFLHSTVDVLEPLGDRLVGTLGGLSPWIDCGPPLPITLTCARDHGRATMRARGRSGQGRDGRPPGPVGRRRQRDRAAARRLRRAAVRRHRHLFRQGLCMLGERCGARPPAGTVHNNNAC